MYYLVPCLNEAAVIQPTVHVLCGDPRSTLIVIDDGSDDATGDLARQAGGGDVVVLRRELPGARKGKGAALNAGIAVVRRLVAERGQHPIPHARSTLTHSGGGPEGVRRPAESPSRHLPGSKAGMTASPGATGLAACSAPAGRAGGEPWLPLPHVPAVDPAGSK